MDIGTVSLLALLAVALAVIVVAFRFKRRVKANIKGPGGVSMTVDGSNEPAPAVVAENIKSLEGGVTAKDATGRGVHARDVEAKRDVVISSEPKKAEPDPKG
jgi:hypothetical protein